MPSRRVWHWIGGSVLGLTVAAATLAALWDWNWFRPIVEARASEGVGRKVTMGRLEAYPGRITTIVFHDLHVANRDGFDGPDFAVIPRLVVTFDTMEYIRTGRLSLPRVEADHPHIEPRQKRDGSNNWTVAMPTAQPGSPTAVQIGEVLINGGTAHAISELTQANVETEFSARHDDNRPEGVLEVTARGTYAGQRLNLHAVGAALLSLRDAEKPYPIDATLESGPTKLSLKGTVQNPQNFAGANLTLLLTGPDMAMLFPLTGIPFPKTTPYRLAGRVDLAGASLTYSDIDGKIGNTDLRGAVTLDFSGARPVLSGRLASRAVDMEDLGGFIGSQPGRPTTPGQSPGQVAAVQRAEADPRLLPTKPIDLPTIRAADIHITYEGARVLGRNTPFDAIAARLDIDDGRIRLQPLRLAMGGGALVGHIDLNPVDNTLDADVKVAFEHIAVGNLLKTLGLGSGRGTIEGSAAIKGRGNSVSAIVGHGDGNMHLVMRRVGEVDALVLSLSGFEIGETLLAALNIPDKEAIRCMTADFELRNGIAASRSFVVDTREHLITGGGRGDLLNERLEAWLRTDVKHFTIGKLATPIRISGTFKDLSFLPDAELVVRGGVAIGLGVLFPPAAVLPTIQFGIGEGSPCAPRSR